MSRRPQRRSRRRSRSGSAAVLFCLVLGLMLLTTPFAPSHGAYSAAQADRSTGLLVVNDGDGGVGISNYTGLQTGETCKLVDVTNNFDADVTVTVQLRDDSTHYGNLTLGSGREGNEVTFRLETGSKQRVGLETKDDASFDGETVSFHLDLTTAAVTVAAADRRSTIDDAQSGTECNITT